MKQVVIENPVINSPFAEPQRHFRFADEGITNEINEARRVCREFTFEAFPVEYAEVYGVPFSLSPVPAPLRTPSPAPYPPGCGRFLTGRIVK